MPKYDSSNEKIADGLLTVLSGITGSALPGDPSSQISLQPVIGTATTFMRSDSAPALSQGVSPRWTSPHEFQQEIGVGVSHSATAHIHVGVSTATRAPLRFTTAGAVLMTVPVPGAIETDGNSLFFTNAAGSRSNFAASSADPTALAGTVAVKGVATTFMRSDASPAINLAATPTWTGSHRFDAGVGIGSAASASAHLAFGAPSEDKAPLRFTAAGPLTTVALPGAVETDGTRLYFTNDSGVRSALSMASERAFDAVKVQDVLNVPETYTQIAHLSTPVRPAGSYLFGIALTYSFNSVNQSVFIRYSSNGGADWNEYQHEASDSTNVEPWTYGYPIVLAAPGSADVILEMRKETAANTLNVLWADIWFHRVA